VISRPFSDTPLSRASLSIGAYPDSVPPPNKALVGGFLSAFSCWFLGQNIFNPSSDSPAPGPFAGGLRGNLCPPALFPALTEHKVFFPLVHLCPVVRFEYSPPLNSLCCFSSSPQSWTDPPYLYPSLHATRVFQKYPSSTEFLPTSKALGVEHPVAPRPGHYGDVVGVEGLLSLVNTSP